MRQARARARKRFKEETRVTREATSASSLKEKHHPFYILAEEKDKKKKKLERVAITSLHLNENANF